MSHVATKPAARLRIAGACALALGLGACVEPVTLRAVPHSGLVNIDPITTTAYITRSHGYLVYDTLFALDQNLEPQPQMVESWERSADGLTWTFKLRPGMRWHDGAPVTAEDCVASLRRWGARDGLGQTLFAAMRQISAPDNRTIVMNLTRPYPEMLEALGKLSSNVPFMMPKRIAEASPSTSITDPTGSGPFRFATQEWVPGRRAVYVRNEDYVPRQEPVSLAAGGRRARLERIEWVTYPSPDAAVDALIAGDVHYLESPPTRLLPRLRAAEGVQVGFTDPGGDIGMMVFNHDIPPFDKVAIRRAVLMTIDQEAYLKAALGDPTLYRTCYSVYPCETPYASDAGSQVLRTANLDRARAALRRAGYTGTPVVILNPTDAPLISAMTKVSVERLRAIGMNVRVEDMTWNQLLARRVRPFPADGQAWNLFHTWWVSADLLDPSRIAFAANPTSGWIGRPLDRQVEQLRAQFAAAGDQAQRQAIARRLQERLFATAQFAPLGQFFEPIAFRSNVIGLQSPIQMYYNLGLRE